MSDVTLSVLGLRGVLLLYAIAEVTSPSQPVLLAMCVVSFFSGAVGGIGLSNVISSALFRR